MWRTLTCLAIGMIACGRNGPDETGDSGDVDDTSDTADTNPVDTADTADTGPVDTADTADTSDTADTGDTGGAGGALDALPGFWGVHGRVIDLLEHDGVVYVGGEFDYAGPVTGMVAAFHPDGSGAAQPTPRLPVVQGTDVGAVISDGQGGLYVGGRVQAIGGEASTTPGAVVHLLADGTLDPDFHLTIDSAYPSVLALALGDGTLYVGGDFAQVDGQGRTFLAAADAATGSLLTWAPQPDGRVSGLLVDGGVVYASGDFGTIGGASRPRGLAGIDATTGVATTWNPTATSAPTGQRRVALSGGAVLLYGYGFGGEEMVAFDAAGSAITAFAPAADAIVRDAVVTGSAVWVGGAFGHIGGQTRSMLAALDPTTGAALSFVPDWGTLPGGGTPTEVLAIALSGTTLYAYLGYTASNQDHLMVVAFDTTTGDRTPFEVLTSGSFTKATLLVDGADLVAASDFQSAGGVARNCLAAFDATTGVATSWAPAVDNGSGGCEVYALTRATDSIYVGGEFTKVGGQSRSNLAAVDTSGATLAWNPGANGGVEALLASGGTVYAGGYFSFVGGAGRPYVAAIDGTSGTATSWNPGADSDVLAFARDGDLVYVGGDFGHVGGQDRGGLAALDATTGLATAWDPTVDGRVSALLVQGGLVLAGGAFDTVGSAPRPALAAIEPDGDLAPWNPAADGTVQRLAVDGDTLWVGGTLATLGGSPATTLGGVSLSTGLATAWVEPGLNQGFQGVVNGVAVGADGRVYGGGDFQAVGAAPALGLAAFEP